jgi:hypothetical protein
MNERYKTMLAVRNASVLGLPPVALTIISPPLHGKTETKKIFLSRHDDCFELTAMSDTALGDELVERRNARVLILDDPLNWEARDLVNAIRYFKNLQGGEITTPRKTRFKRDNIAVPARIHTIVLMHSKQWNLVQTYYMLTGFEERSLICWSAHTREMLRKISDFYLQRNGSDPLPYFVTGNFTLLPAARTLTEEEREWIQARSLPVQSVSSIARAIDEDSFRDIRDYLASNASRTMFIEEVEFV